MYIALYVNFINVDECVMDESVCRFSTGTITSIIINSRDGTCYMDDFPNSVL